MLQNGSAQHEVPRDPALREAFDAFIQQTQVPFDFHRRVMARVQQRRARRGLWVWLERWWLWWTQDWLPLGVGVVTFCGLLSLAFNLGLSYYTWKHMQAIMSLGHELTAAQEQVHQIQASLHQQEQREAQALAALQQKLTAAQAQVRQAQASLHQQEQREAQAQHKEASAPQVRAAQGPYGQGPSTEAGFVDCREIQCSASDLLAGLVDPKVTRRGIGPPAAQLPRSQGVLVLNVVWEPNSARIPSKYYASLNELGKALMHWTSPTIEIAGHTDNVGSAHINQSLSVQRAQSVKQYLVQNFSLSPDRLIVKGYGASQPRATNDTAQGRSINRRVEVVHIGS